MKNSVVKKPSLKIKLFHLWFRLTRATTLGVRVFLQNPKGEILLVKHGYVDGWHLPGGGVEVGDTADETARKELMEETGIEALGQIKLLSVYFNHRVSKRDHVLLYQVEKFRVQKEFKANAEIKEMEFFAPNALPNDTTQSTRNRIDEVLLGNEFNIYW